VASATFLIDAEAQIQGRSRAWTAARADEGGAAMIEQLIDVCARNRFLVFVSRSSP